jgi:hypothetical protein
MALSRLSQERGMSALEIDSMWFTAALAEGGDIRRSIAAGQIEINLFALVAELRAGSTASDASASPMFVVCLGTLVDAAPVLVSAFQKALVDWSPA